MDRLILVTGGLGYVGSVLVPALAKRWPVRVYDTMMFGNSIAGTPNVEFVKGDIRDTDMILKTLEGVTDVIHLAGVVTDELVDMNPHLAISINNEAMNTLCFLCSQRKSVQRFIYASSSSVYGTQPEGRAADENTHPTPMTLYAQSKLAGERILLGSDWGYVTVAVRCATCCGPAPRMRLDTIVNTFCKQAWFDGVITVHGGDQWRTNVHVQDAVDFYALMVEAQAEKVNGQAFNCTADNIQALALADIVSINADIYRLKHGPVRPTKIQVDATRRDDRSYRMSASKADRILGWKPRKSLRDAIMDNFDFFARMGVQNPDDDVYYNTRRMRKFMEEDA